MNSILNHLSVSSSKRSSVYKFFILPTLIIIFIISSVSSVFAYDAFTRFYYSGTAIDKGVNENEMMHFTGSFNGIEFIVDNTDPALFEVGRHYSFDVVFGIWFGSFTDPTDTYINALNSLVQDGYTEEWFAHYVYGFDIGYYDANDNYYNFSPENYYAPQSETVVHYNGQYYSNLTDVLPSLSGSINQNYLDRLYLQVKIHLDFDCTSPMNRISVMWQPYQFKPQESGGSTIFHTSFDVSNILSYDYSTINGMNAIAVDIKSQIAGMESSLTSTLQQLLDQQDVYWDLLLGSYKDSNYDFGMGILYEILDMQNLSYTTLTKMNSSITSIKTYTNTIATNTTAMKNLLNGTVKTFWNFLEDNVDILHQDLVDIKNYLDQSDKSSSLGSDLGSSIDSITNVTGTDISLNDVNLPEFADSNSMNWFSQTVSLIDICIPFILVAFAFGIFKGVFR